MLEPAGTLNAPSGEPGKLKPGSDGLDPGPDEMSGDGWGWLPARLTLAAPMVWKIVGVFGWKQITGGEGTVILGGSTTSEPGGGTLTGFGWI